MDIMYLLIPIALLFIGLAMYFFFWSVKNGQYDDLDSPAHRILFDEDKDMIPPAPYRDEHEEQAQAEVSDAKHDDSRQQP